MSSESAPVVNKHHDRPSPAPEDVSMLSPTSTFINTLPLRWSLLPDDIIAKIISHLNFPQYFIVTISATTFTVRLFEPVAYNVSEFWNILDNLFTMFTTPSVNTFSINLHHTVYEGPCVTSVLDSWARRLHACNNIRHIKIQVFGHCRFADRVCLPSLFQIDSLESLELSLFLNDYDQFVSHPIILPNLKSLTLFSVDYGFLEWLVSCCPSLEYLFFSLNSKPKSRKGSVSISNKILKRLGINLVDMKSVLDDNEIIIDAPKLDHLHLNANSSFLSLRRMLNSISSLKSLELDGNVTLKIFNSPTKTMIFHNLSRLTLWVSSSEVFKAIFKQQMRSHYCPNLEVLVLNFCILYDIVWDTKGTFMLVEHVKRLVLNMGGVRIDRQTLSLVTWLLRSAPVLKKLVISGFGARRSDDFMGKFRETVLKCAEDTSGCEIDFWGGYKLD